MLVDAFDHVFRDRDFHALILFHFIRFADDAVDDTDGVAVALENRDGDRGDAYAKLLLELVQRSVIIRVFLINLRDIERAGHIALSGALPGFFGADAGTVLAGSDDQGGIRNPHGGNHLGFKIKEARGIEQVDLALVPFDGGDGGRDRELAADLFGVGIADSVPLRDLADAVGHTGNIEQAFNKRGLAVAAVAHDADITDLVNVISSHKFIHSLN